jgi:hypothetical protein
MQRSSQARTSRKKYAICLFFRLFTERSFTMNAKALLAVAAVAAAFSAGARADEADASQFAVQIQGQRTRAEVQAEAATVSLTKSFEPAGSRVAAPLKSTVDREALRTQTVQAVRLGQIPSGELGAM